MSAPGLLTASRLKTARACQRLHLYEYVQGFRPVRDSDVLRFGTLVHLGLEAWWRGTDDRLADVLQVLALHDADPFERAKAEALLIGYDARWSSEPLEVLAVEAAFDTELVNPLTAAPSRTWRLAGKVDAVVRTPDGRVLIVEHKTSSEDVRPGSDYWKRLRLDGQVSIYYEGAKSLGFDVQGCLYDVISKPTLKPLKKSAELKLKKDGTPYANQRVGDETPDEYRARILEDIAGDPNGYYGRAEVVRLEAEVAEAMADVWQIGRMLRENDLRGFYPRTVESCVRYGRTCPFFGVCAGEASLDDPSLFRRIDTVHPELADEAKAA